MARILIVATVLVLMLAIVAPTLAEQLDAETPLMTGRSASQPSSLGVVSISGADTTVLIGGALGILTMAALGTTGEQRI